MVSADVASIRPRLNREYAPFLSKAMAVITCATGAFDLTASVDLATRKCCLRSSAGLHNTLAADIPPEECANTLVSSLCAMVNNCFPEVTQRAVRKTIFKFGTLWPTGPHDLLLRGSDSYRGLVYWLPLVRHEDVISTLTRVFLWCRPAFYAEFSNDASRRMLLQAICDRLDWATAGLRQCPQDDSDDPGNRLAAVALFLDYVPRFSLDEWTGWKTFLYGFENVFLSSIASALDACPADLSTTRSQLRGFALRVHASLGVESLRGMSQTAAYHMFHDQLACGGSLAHFRRLLQSLKKRRSCSAPDCPRGAASGGQSTRFLACSGCKVVCYCSKECQLRHWHNHIRPHKLTCRRLKPIVARAPPTADLQVFEKECQLMGVDAEEVSVIVDGLTGHRYHDPSDGEESVAAGIAKLLKEMDFLQHFHSSLAAGTADLPEALKRLDTLNLENEVHTQLAGYLRTEMALNPDIPSRQVVFL
ncbi:hypothetical protein AURDEDRAFT_120872 [Auricularia subglabra TFB-10046 SS5]|nr:hypothetical protein AURDEDRAFT_120872 [Auricularia subglabra TFB-10046 SS5]